MMDATGIQGEAHQAYLVDLVRTIGDADEAFENIVNSLGYIQRGFSVAAQSPLRDEESSIPRSKNTLNIRYAP